MELYDGSGNSVSPKATTLKNGRIHAHRRGGGPFFGECPLCGVYKQIIYSHINPDSTWITTKKDFETKQKIQGGEAFYLLCSECDGWMGKYENYLIKACGRQIMDFMSVVHADKISLALLAILWRAQVAQVIWKGDGSYWDTDTESWAKDLLLQCKSRDDAGIEHPESVLQDQLTWSGLKFFTSDVDTNNPYGQQLAAHPEVNNESRGCTFTAGVFWNLRKGKGQSGIRLRYWGENMRGRDLYEIDVHKSDRKELEELSASTLDDAMCPCGKFETTKTAGEQKHLQFASCCKDGWLRLPLHEDYWRDPNRKLRLQVGSEETIESEGSMSWITTVPKNEPFEDTLKNALRRVPKLGNGKGLSVEIHDNSTGQKRMFLVGDDFIVEMR